MDLDLKNLLSIENSFAKVSYICRAEPKEARLPIETCIGVFVWINRSPCQNDAVVSKLQNIPQIRLVIVSMLNRIVKKYWKKDMWWPNT